VVALQPARHQQHHGQGLDRQRADHRRAGHGRRAQPRLAVRTRRQRGVLLHAVGGILQRSLPERLEPSARRRRGRAVPLPRRLRARTHVAHTAAGVYGAAPAAKIIAVQVFHRSAATGRPTYWESDLTWALNTCTRCAPRTASPPRT
jgi:hypothetical protein